MGQAKYKSVPAGRTHDFAGNRKHIERLEKRLADREQSENLVAGIRSGGDVGSNESFTQRFARSRRL